MTRVYSPCMSHLLVRHQGGLYDDVRVWHLGLSMCRCECSVLCLPIPSADLLVDT